MTDWRQRALVALDDLDALGRRRATRTFDACGPCGTIEGRAVVSFAGNDYLGLSNHPSVVAAAIDADRRWGTGATASRLVVGHRPVHDAFEAAYAAWKGTEAALVTSSGYAANLAVLTTFGTPDVTVVSDQWNHASIIDGCRLARSATAIYRHGEVESFERVLAGVSGPVVVVTDSVFSMDGDVAPLDAIAARCVERGALLVIDEAHDVFGGGFVPPPGLELIRVGTLSKALGSMGGVIAGPAPLVDLVVNRARPFIFSTALAPAATAAAFAALDVVCSAEGVVLVERLRRHVARLVPAHPSPIVPIVIGADADAVAAADALATRGLLVPAIRPPTVPAGTARLRVTMSAAHRDDQVDALVATLAELGLAP